MERAYESLLLYRRRVIMTKSVFLDELKTKLIGLPKEDIDSQIANKTPLMKLVKEKVKPKRTIKAWEIVLIAPGFPILFPLLLVGLVVHYAK